MIIIIIRLFRLILTEYFVETVKQSLQAIAYIQESGQGAPSHRSS